MKSNILTNWFYTTDQVITSNHDLKPTHLLLDGGSVHIKMDLLETFYKLYAECLNTGVPLHIVEHKTPIFKFFCDLDFISNEELNSDIIVNIIHVIQEGIYFIFQENYNLIVCTTDCKKVIKNNEEYVKQGIHLHWPDIFTNCENAILIRNLLVHKLKTVFGERDEINTWDDVVDSCVYKSNGIRMIGSTKCSYDRSNGKNTLIDDKRKYYPTIVLDCFKNLLPDELSIITSDNLTLIKKTSIQSNNDKITKIIQYPEALKQHHEECEECENDKITSKRVLPNSTVYNEIIRFFRIHVKNYSADDIKKILNFDDKVYIILTKSKFCQNIDRAHNSCQIYFKLNKDGISQKCHCICNSLNGRKYGYCKDYTSLPIKCTEHLLKFLNWKIKNKDFNIKNELPTIASMSTKDSKDIIQDYRESLFNKFTNKSPPKQRQRQRKTP